MTAGTTIQPPMNTSRESFTPAACSRTAIAQLTRMTPRISAIFDDQG